MKKRVSPLGVALSLIITYGSFSIFNPHFNPFNLPSIGKGFFILSLVMNYLIVKKIEEE